MRLSSSMAAARRSLRSIRWRANAGSLSLLNGRAFTTAGDLQNSGSLILGGQFTVNGRLSLASSSLLVFNLAAMQGGSASVSGTTSLGGTLAFNLSSSLEAQVTQNSTFTLLASTGLLSDSFSNVADGQRLLTQDGKFTFLVNYGAESTFNVDDVILSDAIEIVPEPSTWTLLLGGVGAVFFMARRRNKAEKP